MLCVFYFVAEKSRITPINMNAFVERAQKVGFYQIYIPAKKNGALTTVNIKYRKIWIQTVVYEFTDFQHHLHLQHPFMNYYVQKVHKGGTIFQVELL